MRWSTEVVDGIRCIYTPGADTKALSTLSYGLTASVDAASRRPDALLVVNVANGLFLPILRTARVPTAVNVDGLEWMRDKWGTAAKRFFHLTARSTAAWADVLISDSVGIQQVWCEEFGRASRHIAYGGDVLSPPSVPVEALGLTPGSYVLVVARMVPENNVELTLDALDKLGSVPAVIVGSANYRSPIVDRLRVASKRKGFHWLGHVADQDLLAALWAHAGLYVHGHSVGGTNPALVQALGFGAPTIALDTTFNREVVEADEQLYPHDSSLLATRIACVLNDDTMRIRLAANGQRIVKERYQWEDVLRAYEQVLIELALSEPRRWGSRTEPE